MKIFVFALHCLLPWKLYCVRFQIFAGMIQSLHIHFLIGQSSLTSLATMTFKIELPSPLTSYNTYSAECIAYCITLITKTFPSFPHPHEFVWILTSSLHPWVGHRQLQRREKISTLNVKSHKDTISSFVPWSSRQV